VAPIIPAGDILVGSRSQRDAIRHCATPFDFSKGALSRLGNFTTLGDPNGFFRPAEQLQVGEIGTGRSYLPTVKEMWDAAISISNV
jgi:hypothetical protein